MNDLADLTKLDLSTLNEDEKRELYDLLKLKNTRAKRDRLTAYRPYAKQREFHAGGVDYCPRYWRRRSGL